MPRSLEQPSVIPDEPESQRSPEFRRTVDYVEELLMPTTGDELRELVNTELYKNASDEKDREQALRNAGLDPEALKKVGANLQEAWESSRSQSDIETVEFGDEESTPFQFVASEEDDDTMRHSDLTIGAVAELNRLMRNVLISSTEDDPIVAESALYAGNSSVSIEQIEHFVTEMKSSHSGVLEKQKKLLKSIPDSRKQRPLALATFLLDSYTLDRLGKRPLRKR